MNINIHYVWAGIIVWSVVSLLAMVFICGADERSKDSRKRKTQLGTQ